MSPTNSEIAALDGEGRIPAYVARPDADTTRAIIVIPEIFGVNEGIRKKADDWAALGGYFGQYDADLGVKDIEAAIRWLRSQGATKVGCVGFCLGGRLAYMAATRTDIDASVGYYGVMIDTMLNEAHAIAKPLMLHIPTEDHFVDHAAQAKIHEALDPNPKVTLHDYAGLDHGFAATMGNRRNDDGAQLADSRTRDFFAEALA